MKVTLTFDLPDERDELMSALHGQTFSATLFNLDQELRNTLKYTTGPDDCRRYLEQLRNRLYEGLAQTNWRD